MLAKNFKLQDATETGKWKEVETGIPFDQAFRPDHRIDMAIIFPYDPESEFECPSCGKVEAENVDPSKVEWSVFNNAQQQRNSVMANKCQQSRPKLRTLL